ncbi:hypothetical protein [Dactylosporangium sp. NPDC048998]|uniref:hypothetical protein n=1 Tax=Dactylosporangium sp. NPDC048998 TaxID=3363976 RepID=UPI00371DCD00
MTQQPPQHSEIHITGGQFSGPFAAGYQAQAIQHVAGDVNVNPMVQTELARLAALIAEHRPRLPEAARVERDHAEVAGELALPPAERDRDRIDAALDRIVKRSAAVAAIVASVEKVRQLLHI